LEEFSKKTLQEYVCQYIRSRIINGTYVPNERLVELKIAKELGVSQGPVREALQELEVMGLVYKKPYSGSFVASFTAEEVVDNFRFRTLLETFAIREAIRKISSAEIKKLRSILNTMAEAVRNPDVEACSELDIEFHGVIVKAARIPSLYRAWEISRTAQWTYITLCNDEMLEAIPKSHAALLQYFDQKDEAKAVAELQHHFDSALSHILEDIEEKRGHSRNQGASD